MNDKEKVGEYAWVIERLAQNLNRNTGGLQQALGARSSPVASALTELSDGLVDECPSGGPEFQAILPVASRCALEGVSLRRSR